MTLCLPGAPLGTDENGLDEPAQSEELMP
nr:hypothetical protein [Tanacetum cinerariifolium]